MMKNNIFNPLKALAALVVVFGLLVVTNCGEKDPEPEPEPDPTESIMQLIRSTDGLDSLEKYLTRYPDLVAGIEGSGTFTFFAPTNTAFINLLATPGFPENIDLINPDIIKGVLAYHVAVGQALEFEDFGPSVTLNTLYTDPGTQAVQTITFTSDKKLVTGSTSTNPVTEDTDIRATNGIMHTTSFVLIPPSVGASLTPLLGKIAGSAMLGASFTHLANLIRLADSEVPTGQIPILGYLTSNAAAGLEGKTYTLFAPANPVLEGVAALQGFESVGAMITALGLTTPAAARGFLLNHIVEGTKLNADLTNNSVLTSLLGLPLNVVTVDVGTSTPLGKVLFVNYNITPAPLFIPDIAADNGVIHVSAPLIPKLEKGPLGTNLGNMLLSSNFSILASAVAKADEFATSAELPTLASVLGGPNRHTVFAPTNGTFEAGSITADTYTGQQWYGIILNHVVLGDITEENLTHEASLQTALTADGTNYNSLKVFKNTAAVPAQNGVGIYLDSNGDVDFADPTTYNKLNAEIALLNAAQATNGRIHVIAGVLAPPQ